MAIETTRINGKSFRRPMEDIGREFQDTVLPHAAHLAADAEAVVRSEFRLAEARLFYRFTKLKHRAIAAATGAGILFVAFVLFVVTLVFAMRDFFPQLPLWADTGILCLAAAAIGAGLVYERDSDDESDLDKDKL